MAGYDRRQKALSIMCVLYSGKFTPQQAALYEKFLADLPEALVEGAVSLLCKTSVYPPTVAEIRKKAEDLWRESQGESLPDAGRAWKEAMDAVAKVGSYGTPHFEDELTAEAVRRFGWKELCQHPTDTAAVARAQFMRIYEALAEEKKETRELQRTLKEGDLKQLLQRIADKRALQEAKKGD